MRHPRSLTPLFLSFLFSWHAWGQAGVTMVVKTDMVCQWKLDGAPMGVLRTGIPIVILVAPGEHVVEAVAMERVGTLRTKVKVDNVEKTVDLGMKLESEQEAKTGEEGASRKRTGAARAPVWTDTATGLTWASEDNGADVGWPEANAYCSKLKLAGYKDWRLPSLDELQAIYDPTITAHREFGDGQAYDVHVKGNLKLTGRIWSSALGDKPGRPDQWAFHFGFGNHPYSEYNKPEPQKNFLHMDYNLRALCVRRAGD